MSPFIVMINNKKSNQMKNKLKIFAIMAVGVLLSTTCTNNLPMPTLQTGCLPLITKDATKNQTINYLDLTAFDAAVKVDLYYPTDKCKSMDLMVKENGNKNKVGTLKANITTFPTTAAITMSSLIDALPNLTSVSDINPGDQFKVYTDVTLLDGMVLNGSDTLYAVGSSGIGNLPNISTSVTYTVVCPLDLNDFVGNYTMDDGSPSDLCTIEVSLDPGNPDGLIINDFYAGTGTGALHPVHLNVNRITYGISVPSPQVFADWLWSHSYLNATLSNLSGTLDACTSNFSFKAQLDVSAGGFGTITYTCTKL